MKATTAIIITASRATGTREMSPGLTRRTTPQATCQTPTLCRLPRWLPQKTESIVAPPVAILRSTEALALSLMATVEGGQGNKSGPCGSAIVIRRSEVCVVENRRRMSPAFVQPENLQEVPNIGTRGTPRVEKDKNAGYESSVFMFVLIGDGSVARARSTWQIYTRNPSVVAGQLLENAPSNPKKIDHGQVVFGILPRTNACAPYKNTGSSPPKAAIPSSRDNGPLVCDNRRRLVNVWARYFVT